MSYDFLEHFKSTILEINNSNKLLFREGEQFNKLAEHQKELEEIQHQASEDEAEELNFNDS